MISLVLYQRAHACCEPRQLVRRSADRFNDSCTLTNIHTGDFGIMTLRRQGGGHWMVAGVELLSLDPAIAAQSP